MPMSMPEPLLVIVPSRGRPRNIAALWDAWSGTTAGFAVLLVACDDDDETLPGYERVCADRGIELTVGPRLRMVPTLNKVAVERAGSHFAVGFMGDDHRPRTRGWDRRYVDELNRLGTGIVYGDDLFAGERLPTQWAQTSDMVAVLGAMVPAPVIHLWADNAIYDLGHGIDRIRYLPDVVIEHMHPHAGKGVTDARYEEVNAPEVFASDKRIYADWYANRREADVARVLAHIADATRG